jgi:hypothetical protein
MTTGEALDRLPSMLEKLEKILEPREQAPDLPEWITMRKACELKGVPFNTVRQIPELQPNQGVPDRFHQNVAYFRRETILEWLHVMDENRSEYLAICAERRKQARRYVKLDVDTLKSIINSTLSSRGEISTGELFLMWPDIAPKRFLDALDTMSIEGVPVYQSIDGKRIGILKK